MSEEDEQLRGLSREAMQDEVREHPEPPCPWGPPETCKWGDACADCGRVSGGLR